MTTVNRPYLRVGWLVLLFSMACISDTRAQEDVPSPDPAVSVAQVARGSESQAQPRLLTNYVETGGSYLALSNGYGHWSGGYARAVYQQGGDVWNGEVNGQHEFGDSGVYFAAGDTHTLNANWYGSLTVSSSVGGFFWPRFRTDGFINKKWLGRKQWITTAGFGYYAAKDAHRDHSFFLGSTYYFEKPWIAEAGMHFNLSNPGMVFAPAGFLAVTQGRSKQHYFTVRAGFGEEAYELIGPARSLAQFHSETLTVTWRKWVGVNWGLNFVGDYYHSPFYHRGGSSFGLFKDF